MVKFAAALLALMVPAAFAADMAPLLSNGPERSTRQEYDNKALGLLFHRTLFAEGDPQLAVDLIMDTNFINHDVEEPSGAQHFADFFLHPEQYQNPNPMRSNAPHAASPAALTRLFVVTDGDLTMMAYATRDIGDPGGRFASNMFETKAGRVSQWWFSGPTNMDMSAPRGAPPPGGAPAAGAAPATPPPPPDYSKYYPQPGATVVGMQSLVPLGVETTRAQREANKQLVATFFDEYFNKKHVDAAARYLAADIRSHVIDQPSGAAFLAALKAQPAKFTAEKTDAVLFLLAEGELVDIGWPAPQNGDAGAWYAQNLLRVHDGKIVEWWYSGFPYGKPRFVNPWNRLGYDPKMEPVAGH